MANYNSTNVTNVVATPQAILHRQKGLVQGVVDTIEVTTAHIDNASNDFIYMLPLNSNDILLDLQIFSDDLDSNVSPALAYNIGLAYSGKGTGQKNQAAYTVISANCIGSAVTVGQSANTTGGQLVFQNNDIANIGKELWQIAGLTADCGGIFYLVLDISTAAATPVAGTISVRALVM